MRLLLINYEYPPIGAGAATATAAMARSAAGDGHEVVVLTTAFGDQAGWCSDGSISLLRVRARRQRADQSSIREMASFVWHAAWAMPGVVRRFRPQGCVVFFSVPCGPLGLLFRVLARAPYVVSLRGGDVPGTDPSVDRMHRWLRWPRRLALRGATAVVANSPGLAEFSRRADPVEVRVIPNGVDIERFRPGPAPLPEPFRFLFVGRLIEQKKVHHLLEAVARLARAPERPFRLTLVGDGPLRAAVVARATALGIDGVVDWIPWVDRDQMPGAYQSAHCVVNASHGEGMPNVVLEAMACGVPVIVSDVSGNRDLVEHGRTGWIVPRDSLDELVGAMARAMREPEALRALGEAGCATVRERYSWAGATRQYLELLGAAGP